MTRTWVYAVVGGAVGFATFSVWRWAAPIAGVVLFVVAWRVMREANRILEDALDEADAAEAMRAEARRLHDEADDWWKP